MAQGDREGQSVPRRAGCGETVSAGEAALQRAEGGTVGAGGPG